MEIRSHKDLIVWQKAMDLLDEVYRLIEFLPHKEMYALSDQMRRASISILSNIAEGHRRNSTKDYLYFLFVARGSTAELDTQIEICIRRKYFSRNEAELALSLCEEVHKILNSIIAKLKAKENTKH